MDWFKEHLNWTLILGCVVMPNVLINIPLILLGQDALGTVGYLVWIGCVVVAAILVELWYLRQKGRSLWHCFWNMLGIVGLIILLNLENRHYMY